MKESKLGSKREIWLDLLRIIAMVAVVLNHSWGLFSYDQYDIYMGTPIFYVDNLLNCATRFNVPVFFMISGAMMLTKYKQKSIRTCVLKAIKGGVLPLIAWTLIYAAVNWIAYDGNILNNILISISHPMPYCNHLWFMYSLIICYLLTPILLRIAEDDKILDFFLIIWVIYAVIYGFFNHYSGKGIAGYWNINIAGGYVGWYVLGYKLYKSEIKEDKTIICFMVFLISNISTSFLMLLGQKITGRFDSYMHDFFSPSVVAASISIFLFIKYYFLKSTQENKIIHSFVNFFAPLTANIYFVHFMIRDLFLGLYKSGVWGDYLYYALCPVLTLSLSTIFSFTVSLISQQVKKLTIKVNSKNEL